MLCTSSFTDDVTFSYSGPYGANGIVTLGRTESDVYECLVIVGFFIKKLSRAI